MRSETSLCNYIGNCTFPDVFNYSWTIFQIKYFLISGSNLALQNGFITLITSLGMFKLCVLVLD